MTTNKKTLAEMNEPIKYNRIAEKGEKLYLLDAEGKARLEVSDQLSDEAERIESIIEDIRELEGAGLDALEIVEQIVRDGDLLCFGNILLRCANQRHPVTNS